MAKKKSSTVAKNEFTRVLAFCTLVLAGVLWVLSAFKIGGGILVFIKDLMLLTTISMVAYPFARKQHIALFVIYWIIVILAFVGIICGSFELIKL